MQVVFDIMSSYHLMQQWHAAWLSLRHQSGEAAGTEAEGVAAEGAEGAHVAYLSSVYEVMGAGSGDGERSAEERRSKERSGVK